jgi:hypothetical protein
MDADTKGAKTSHAKPSHVKVHYQLKEAAVGIDKLLATCSICICIYPRLLPMKGM